MHNVSRWCKPSRRLEPGLTGRIQQCQLALCSSARLFALIRPCSDSNTYVNEFEHLLIEPAVSRKVLRQFGGSQQVSCYRQEVIESLEIFHQYPIF